MEFDQKEETPFNIPEKKKTNKKTLALSSFFSNKGSYLSWL